VVQCTMGVCVCVCVCVCAGVVGSRPLAVASSVREASARVSLLISLP